MKVTLNIKYYVPIDHLMGKTEVIQIEKESKLTDILEILAGKYQGFASPNSLDQIVMLVNGKVCDKDEVVADGDQISILTPLVGG